MTDIDNEFINRVWKVVKETVIQFNEMEKAFNLCRVYKEFFKKAGYYNPDNGDKISIVYNDGNLDVKIYKFPKKDY